MDRSVEDLQPPDRPSSTAAALAAVVVGTVLGGLALFGFHATRPDAFVATSDRTVQLGLLVFLLVLCEIRPVKVVRGGGADEIVASTTFAFALLLMFGPAAALCGQVVASVLADVANRKEVRRLAFNVGQYCLGWGVAGLVFEALSGVTALGEAGAFSGRAIAATFVAGITYFAVNNSLVGLVVAVEGRMSVARTVWSELREEAATDWVLLAVAPIVVVVADRSLALLPLLLLPAYGAYRSASISIEKEHQATHDALTDLPNRLLFNTRLDQVLGRARRSSGGAAILLIDLDRFKEVNDTLGHHTGDALLQQVGPRIATAIPEGATVARLGGDEFVVVLDGADGPVDCVGRATRVVEALERPFDVGEFRLDVEASIGIARFPQHGDDKETLLQRADVAMYVAKAAHRSIEVYDPDTDHHSRRRLTLLGELRTAVDAREIVALYQPKVNLVTGEIEAVEALARWDHPELGLLTPNEFLPLAEHTGLIRPLTSFVLEEAIGQARTWRDAGVDLPVAVNLSARNLHDQRLPQEIAGLLDRFRLEPRSLQVEITESSIMAEPGRARRILDELDAMGIRLAIDDFGTGYSSLAYLQQLPVREIKIDRSFVVGMAVNDGDAVIVRSTIDLARNLGLHVVAEGVEDCGTLDLLRAARCDAVQGYFITPALAPGALVAWLARRAASAEAAAVLDLTAGATNVVPFGYHRPA